MKWKNQVAAHPTFLREILNQQVKGKVAEQVSRFVSDEEIIGVDVLPCFETNCTTSGKGITESHHDPYFPGSGHEW